MRNAVTAMGVALALAGCGAATRPALRSVPAARVIAHRGAALGGPATEPGLEGVIGAGRAALEGQFGPTRLDIRDGDATRLQWSGSACVLDAYLYPPETGGAPVTTYVDARRGDGRDVDKAACVAALKKR